ncbi:MAG: ABC-type phosphate transport system substrate-binding protein [Psychrobacter glaciei]|jgi:ABC-type phosphate transport system substrate-binding protein
MKTLLFILICFSQYTFADLQVIANKSFNESSISMQKLRDIYSGDSQYINGIRIIPLDQSFNTENRALFYDLVLEKPMDQIMSHWSKLIFTGKGQAPTSLSGDASILEFVSGNLNAIGYVGSDMPIINVKIIQTIKVLE